MGYKIAILRNHNHDPLICDLMWDEPYEGYPKACNQIIRRVAEIDPQCRWFVTGGHDIMPDTDVDADTIAEQCTQRFGGTFGVMEPTGDRWMEDELGRSANERVAAAPWIGREFALKTYGGNGPYFTGYWHDYSDNELAEVSELLGVRWMRRDLTQYNDHWMRQGGRRPSYHFKIRDTVAEAAKVFAARKADGFPGHESI